MLCTEGPSLPRSPWLPDLDKALRDPTQLSPHPLCPPPRGDAEQATPHPRPATVPGPPRDRALREHRAAGRQGQADVTKISAAISSNDCYRPDRRTLRCCLLVLVNRS